MEKYNNIKYTFKQAKRMLYVHKGKLQMGLPEWDKGESIRVYQKPDVKACIYQAYRTLNPELPKEELYLPDDMYVSHLKICELVKHNLGDALMTEPFLYKHTVLIGNITGTVVVKNNPWTPTLKETKRKDWILYKL